MRVFCFSSNSQPVLFSVLLAIFKRTESFVALRKQMLVWSFSKTSVNAVCSDDLEPIYRVDV